MAEIKLLEPPPPDLWLAELCDRGAVSFPILDESTRKELLEEANNYPYSIRPETVGSYQVKQYFSAFDKFPGSSKFYELRDEFETLITTQLEQLSIPTLTEPLLYNDMVLQRYEIGKLGISPHMDRQSCQNLIAAFTLVGKCKFCICDDRDGSNAWEINSDPGTVILLPTEGFAGMSYRPFHFLSDITKPRISFALRQHQ